MRNSFGFSAPTHAVTRLLIVIIATYLVFALFGHTGIGFTLFRALILLPYETVFSFELWRIVTYGFMHDPLSPLHVILNALMLYMIGPSLEDRWGEKRFLLFIMAAVITGGFFVCIAFLVGLSSAPVLGFSAATLALIVAWGITFSNQSLYIFGILPLTGKQMVYATIGLEVIYAVSGNSISSAAHFGGIVSAIIFTLGLYRPARLKQMWQKKSFKSNFRR